MFDIETDDEHTKRNHILAIRLYLILLTVISYTYAFYTTLDSYTTIIIVSTLAIEQYAELIQKFPNSSECSCELISVPYENFISILPIYDQICSSDFVSQQWIDYLFYENTSYYFQLDFRHSALAQFQILRTLCQQAQQVVDNSLTQFYCTQLITNQLVSMESFDIQTDSFIRLFKETTPPSFLDVLTLIRLLLIQYVALSGMDTNYSLKCCVGNIDVIAPDVIRYGVGG